jgi:tetratricopeptide (TPR) repeat protein
MSAMWALRGAALVAATLALSAGMAPPQEPRSARALYERAVELDAAGDQAGALSLLWKAAGVDPADADIQNQLGESLQRIGALDAAIESYRAALAARPSFRKAANNLVLALVAAGRGSESTDLARRLVAAAPDAADAHFTLGLAQAEQDVDEAVRSFQRAIEIAPDDALARYNLALVLRRMDRLDAAADELRQAIAIAPRAEAHFQLGVIRWHQHRLEEAADALRAAIALDPKHAEAHHALGGVLHAAGDRARAIQMLRRAAALRPELADVHYTLARVLRAAGDAAGAAHHQGEADRLRERARLEQEARVWTSTGSARMQAGDLIAAVDHFRRAASILDAYAPAHYQLGIALLRLGQVDAARDAFARAQQLNPSLVPPTARTSR